MLSVPGEPALLPLYSSRHRALPWGSSRDGKPSEHYADVPRFLPYTEGPLPPETVVSRHFNSELISYTLFRHTNASQAFRGLQRFVHIRFRRYLTQRSKGRGFGWKRFPNSKLKPTKSLAGVR